MLYEEKQATIRPINPTNGSFFTDKSGQGWEFRNGTFQKSDNTREQRAVRK